MHLKNLVLKIVLVRVSNFEDIIKSTYFGFGNSLMKNNIEVFLFMKFCRKFWLMQNLCLLCSIK